MEGKMNTDTKHSVLTVNIFSSSINFNAKHRKYIERNLEATSHTRKSIKTCKIKSFKMYKE